MPTVAGGFVASAGPGWHALPLLLGTQHLLKHADCGSGGKVSRRNEVYLPGEGGIRC